MNIEWRIPHFHVYVSAALAVSDLFCGRHRLPKSCLLCSEVAAKKVDVFVSMSCNEEVGQMKI